jgi:predicted O-methyltransferase YrrM
MIRKLKNLLWRLFNLSPIGPLLQLYLEGDIRHNGWMRSFQTKRSENAAGQPIPWYTYPAIDFLHEKLNNSHRIFEYGCGGSTRWLAQRCGHITAVEDHPQWYQYASQNMPANVTIHLQTLDNQHSYENTPNNSKQKYDIIIVDGKQRNSCIAHSISALAEGGVLILDDSFRSQYQPSFDLLQQQGYRKLNFWGMTAIVATKSCTTIFYKPNNCLDI